MPASIRAQRHGDRAAQVALSVSPATLSGRCPELLYINFKSKDQTLILAMVLTVKSELLRSYYDFIKILL